MSDDSQLVIPASFIALYVPAGRVKPTLGHAQLLERYEYCEDLATALTDTAAARRADLHVTENDVLERIARGLAAADAGLSADEAGWVLRRLAELLGWPPLRDDAM